MQIAQGELVLTSVSRLPGGLRSGMWQDRLVLASGETGNAHVLVTKGQSLRWLYQAVADITDDTVARQEEMLAGTAYVEIIEVADLVHEAIDEGHEPSHFPAGIYQVALKREEFPWPDAGPSYVLD